MANYQSPTWVNNQAPKLNAANLQLLTDTVEASQVLSGTGAPGSSVAAVVGQKYVDESTTPGTIYKCTSVENGDSIWEKEVTRPEFAALEAETQTAYESFATDTASGAIASFPDGADGVPVKTLVVNIAPVQAGEGDPTPDNIRPLSGLTGGTVTRVGKNLFRPYTAPSTLGGVTMTPNGDGSFYLEGTASEDPFTATRTLPFPIAPMTKVSFRLGNDTINSEVGIRSLKRVDGVPSAFGKMHLAEAVDQTVDGDTDNFSPNNAQVFVTSGHGDVAKITMRPQLELGDKATAWEAYTEESIPVTWETEAGTIYAGTLELPSGVLTVTKTLVVVGENFPVSRISSVTQYGTDTGFWLALGTDTNTVADKMQNRCNQASPSASVGITSGTTNQFGAAPIYPHSVWVRLLTETVGTTVDSVHAYITAHPMEFVVGLATPVQYQLTPAALHTVLGVNHIFSDAGDVTVEYRANTNLYIDKRLETLAANFATVENGESASRNYTVGEFLVYVGILYKVIAAIASGETLTPGTNITPATVGAELTELEA